MMPSHVNLSRLSTDMLIALRTTYRLSRSEHERGTTPTAIFLYLVACGWLDAIGDELLKPKHQAALQARELHLSKGQ